MRVELRPTASAMDDDSGRRVGRRRPSDGYASSLPAAGYDARPMEFEPNGDIGKVDGRLEMRWRVHQCHDDLFLDIGNEAAITCRLKWATTGFGAAGFWEDFEQMPVEVYPQPDPPPAVDGIGMLSIHGLTAPPVPRFCALS